MKKLIFFTAGLLISWCLAGQVPEAFKYQAVARDVYGAVISNQYVSFRISILRGSSTGDKVYSELQYATTNPFGLVDLEIGKGSVISGGFKDINWAAGVYFISVEMDPGGGTAFQTMGTSQLLSVPFALHAKTAESAAGGTTPGGSKGYVQFNSGSHFGGDANLFWDDNNKRLGIGTTYPEGLLHLSSNSYVNSPNLLLTENEKDFARLMMKNTSSTEKNWTIAAYLDAINGNSKLNFWYDDGTSGSNIMSVSGDGKVGIATEQPQASLDVNGSVKIGPEGSVVNEIRVVTGTTSGSQSQSLWMPPGYNNQNTIILSVEFNISGNSWKSIGTGCTYEYFNDGAFWLIYTNAPEYGGKPYRIVMMKVQ